MQVLVNRRSIRALIAGAQNFSRYGTFFASLERLRDKPVISDPAFSLEHQPLRRGRRAAESFARAERFAPQRQHDSSTCLIFH
ncbi:hypothetical protein [Caballeronia temeraria]|uniref:hypothetical protein n=1 Tax=Caballeronia temeraria TaxID=1777137 RepID=UPI0012FDD52D|nr:hypothetical protein [Caballeronia temeraria]